MQAENYINTTVLTSAAFYWTRELAINQLVKL